MACRELLGTLAQEESFRHLTPLPLGETWLSEWIACRVDFDAQRTGHGVQRSEHETRADRYVRGLELADPRRARPERTSQIGLRPTERLAPRSDELRQLRRHGTTYVISDKPGQAREAI
jgi:hypothetical protein